MRHIKKTNNMRKLLFIFLLLTISISSFSQTNIYHPFPTSHAAWREYFEGQYNQCIDYQYTIGGDTSISGKTYYKIIKSGVQYAIMWGLICNYDSVGGAFSGYFGAYREDTSTKKVYFVYTGLSNESLLYCFNLNIGDTLYNSFGNDSLHTHNYVSSVDSVLVGSEYHKRFGISEPGGLLNYFYLIEGIGSTYGLIGYLEPPFEAGSILVCFMQNDVPAYIYEIYHAGCDYVSINEREPLPLNNISVNPNPLSSTATIEFGRSFKNIGIKILNLEGQLISEKMLTSSDHAIIDRKNIANGFYILKITLDNKYFLAKKIIITE